MDGRGARVCSKGRSVVVVGKGSIVDPMLLHNGVVGGEWTGVLDDLSLGGKMSCA
jgi:hypothetical protein